MAGAKKKRGERKKEMVWLFQLVFGESMRIENAIRSKERTVEGIPSMLIDF